MNIEDDVFTRANPDPAKVEVSALEAILEEAATQQSDGVAVALGDTIVAEKYFGHTPALATIQSITKSVVSLEIGALIASGKIPSLDTPVSTYFTEWSSGDKAKVTMRNLLAHDELFGLRDDGSTLFEQPDALAYARAQSLVGKPVAGFAYSNVGSMLLGGIITQAGGNGADVLVRDQFLTPMGIKKWKWGKDPAGNVMTPGGLFLAPRDLLRLGRLVRDQGAWSAQSLVSAKWITDSTAAPSAKYECYALHWWLLRDGAPHEGSARRIDTRAVLSTSAREPHAQGERCRDGPPFLVHRWHEDLLREARARRSAKAVPRRRLTDHGRRRELAAGTHHQAERHLPGIRARGARVIARARVRIVEARSAAQVLGRRDGIDPAPSGGRAAHRYRPARRDRRCVVGPVERAAARDDATAEGPAFRIGDEVHGIGRWRRGVTPRDEDVARARDLRRG